MLHWKGALRLKTKQAVDQEMTIYGIPRATGPNTPEKEAVLNASAPEPVIARALVPLERTEPISVLRSARPEASFVAHLIATAELTPQTRALRRANPAAAQATYDRAKVKGSDGYGRLLSQIA